MTAAAQGQTPLQDVAHSHRPTAETTELDREKESTTDLADSSKRDSTSTLRPNDEEPKATEEKDTASHVHEKTVLSLEESHSSDKEDEDEVEYPSGLKLAVISLALCLAVFLMALDNTIIATAIPKITDRFNSLDDIGWYASAYLLTTCALTLFFGK